MKQKNPDIDFVCDKCGKHPPVDKEKSNENWTAYTSDRLEDITL